MIYEINYEEKPNIIENHLNLGGCNKHEDIRINSRYLLKDGVPWIPVMGEIHYVRVPKERWEEELQKMKAGGITVVSCYVIWIYHEEREGEFCFKGRRDLKEFVKTVVRCGLKLCLRVGPWVHGEVRNGGFPDWLVKKSFPLRENNVEYLGYVKRFFESIYQEVNEFLFEKNGPIWAIQLENELTNQAEHLLMLRKMAEEVGLWAPIYTVTGWNSKYGAEIPEYDVLPVFGGYPGAPWEEHLEKLEPSSHYFFLPVRNDSSIGKDLIADVDDADVFHMNYDLYPFATCELGGGIPNTHHRRPVVNADDIAALGLVKLGCGNNMPGYYMYHGGVNDISKTTLHESKKTGYPNDYPIRNYDFQAPIGAWGQLRDSYRKLKLQHLFIKCYGRHLAAMDAYFQVPEVLERSDKTSLRYSVRSDGKSGFVFINNYQRLECLADHDDVKFKVPVQGGEMIFPKEGMYIPSGAYCCMPYLLPLGNMVLKYATAQLLYQSENTWFFFSPFGISAKYCVIGKDKVEVEHHATLSRSTLKVGESEGEQQQIVTLSQQDAEHFYVVNEEIYITDGADIYEADGGITLRREGSGDLTFYRWNGDCFAQEKCCKKEKSRYVEVQEIMQPQSEITYEEELLLGGQNKRKGYRLLLPPDISQQEEAYLEIEYVGDVLQIYVDGILAIDDFYNGRIFEVGIQELLQYGQNVEIWISELKSGSCYLESEITEGLMISQVNWKSVYTFG